jgi:hypothetical protein
MLKLYHESKLVGLISNPADNDRNWKSGDVALTPEGEKYKPLFAYLTTDDDEKDPNQKFEDAMYDNWFIEDEHGVRLETIIPAIHSNGDIYWRTDET